ncbi:MAG: FAD-binding protein [Eubacteriales bacterium]|nr:FAD-binding protein [Eubacteriales bacterium]
MKKVLAILTMICLLGVQTFSTVAEASGSYQAGTYTGTGEGRFGTITVKVTVSDSAIEAVEVMEHHDSAGVSDLPISRIPADIVKYQSLGVDTVSGATLTSYGTINATADALTQTGADVTALRKVEVNYDAMPTEDMENDEAFGKSAEHLVAYDNQDGLYAVYLFPTSLGTVGGALTDEAFHVLDTEDQVIENLFAVGEVATSTLFGDYYVGSFSLGLYTAAGMTAARTAVFELIK